MIQNYCFTCCFVGLWKRSFVASKEFMLLLASEHNLLRNVCEHNSNKWGIKILHNKKFWEELITYFP
jgi:hypothetical protein